MIYQSKGIIGVSKLKVTFQAQTFLEIFADFCFEKIPEMKHSGAAAFSIGTGAPIVDEKNNFSNTEKQ